MNRERGNIAAVVALAILVVTTGCALVLRETRQQETKTRLAEKRSEEAGLVAVNPREEDRATAKTSSTKTPAPAEPRGEGDLVATNDSRFISVQNGVAVEEWKLSGVMKNLAIFTHKSTGREFGMRLGDSFDEVHNGRDYRVTMEEIDNKAFRVVLAVEEGRNVEQIEMELF